MDHRTVLVTGGAGFIGSHVSERLLSKGFSVIVIDDESTGLKQNVPVGAIYIKGDICNKHDFEAISEYKIDAVFHIAGQASNIRSFSNPTLDLKTNVVGTLNILEYCLQRKIPRLIYASSMTVYGHPRMLPVSENEIPRPVSYYGITKYAAERYVLSTAQRNDLDSPFNVTAFRMFNVYGERQRLDNPYQGVLGFFVGNVLRKEPITVHGDGEQTRDFIYISDVVDAWMASLDNPNSYGKTFNLGSGEAISINKLVDIILSAKKYTRKNYPMKNGAERPGDQKHMVADISLAEQNLDWSPKVPLLSGIDRTLAWASMVSGS